MPINKVESDVLDELYFVISFNDVTAAMQLDENVICKALSNLLEQGYVQQLKFSQSIGDFEKMDEPDTANLSGYHYLATKKGLLAHNLDG